MATINDLNKSISDMSVGELHERLRQIRSSRRTSKVSKKTSKKKDNPKVDLKRAIRGMDSTTKQKLIEELERLSR